LPSAPDSKGYRRFQLKVGGEPGTDIARIRAVAGVLEPGDRLIADANTGWLMHDTARVVRAVRDVDVYIEQPCASFEECLLIRRRTDHPFVMDESIDDIDVLLHGHAEGAMDVVNLKISKLGGITKLRQARDLCASLGIAVTIEDSWGSDITKAAIAHLTRTTANELGEQGIRVNAICPGGVATSIFGRAAGLDGDRAQATVETMSLALGDMQPIRRSGQPADIAEAALWLAGDASSFVSGQAIAVDGGLTTGPLYREQHAKTEGLVQLLRSPGF